MFFDLFKKKEKEEFTRANYYVCKHCKFNCNDCKSVFCFSCDIHEGNPCPKCGKTNKQANEAKEAEQLKESEILKEAKKAEA